MRDRRRASITLGMFRALGRTNCRPALAAASEWSAHFFLDHDHSPAANAANTTEGSPRLSGFSMHAYCISRRSRSSCRRLALDHASTPPLSERQFFREGLTTYSPQDGLRSVMTASPLAALAAALCSIPASSGVPPRGCHRTTNLFTHQARAAVTPATTLPLSRECWAGPRAAAGLCRQSVFCLAPAGAVFGPPHDIASPRSHPRHPMGRRLRAPPSHALASTSFAALIDVRLGAGRATLGLEPFHDLASLLAGGAAWHRTGRIRARHHPSGACQSRHHHPRVTQRKPQYLNRPAGWRRLPLDRARCHC